MGIARFILAVSLALIVGAAIGAALVAGLGSAKNGSVELAASGPTLAPTKELATPELREPAPAPGPAQLEASRVAAPQDGNDASAELFGPVHVEYGELELALGWSEVRADSIPAEALEAGIERYEEVVRSTPRDIGRELARLASERDAALGEVQRGGLFGVLSALESDGVGPLVELVADSNTYGELFRCDELSQGMTLEAFLNAESVPSGASIQLPAGVVKVNRWPISPENWPTCLTIAGRGMNSTLLVHQEISARARVDRLTIRDCTLMNSGPLFDLRTDLALVVLERVRIVGFDTGAGGSSAINTRGSAMVLRDCRIEGGYGRSKDGQLLDIRTDANLLRFERCTLDRLRLNVFHWRPGATVVFDQCHLDDLLDRRDPRESGHAGLRFLGGRLNLASEERRKDHKRDLNDLFPGWREDH